MADRWHGCSTCKRAGKRGKRGAGIRIVFDPAIQIPGSPTIEGHRLAAEMIVDYVVEYGGLDNSEVVAYDVTREEQITACWWAGLWGPRKYRKMLGEWAEVAGSHLWHGCINVPNLTMTNGSPVERSRPADAGYQTPPPSVARSSSTPHEEKPND